MVCYPFASKKNRFPRKQQESGSFFYNFLIPLQRDVPGLWDFWIREKDNESLTLSPETAALIRF